MDEGHQAAAETFESLSCEQVLYRFQLSPDKFRYDLFSERIHVQSKADEWNHVEISNPEHGYHVHLSWINEVHRYRIEIGFYEGPGEDSLPDDVPAADGFMAWMGSFFPNESASVHIHADFLFEASRKKSRFPLPMRVSIGTAKTEVDGISIKLIDSPGGISKVWVTQRANGLGIQLHGDRKITFSEFSVFNDIKAFLEVLNTVIEDNPA
jgi:hypothetical protein